MTSFEQFRQWAAINFSLAGKPPIIDSVEKLDQEGDTALGLCWQAWKVARSHQLAQVEGTPKLQLKQVVRDGMSDIYTTILLVGAELEYDLAIEGYKLEVSSTKQVLWIALPMQSIELVAEASVMRSKLPEDLP